MICYNCGYNLPANDITNCPLCGMKFPVKCEECDAFNPLMAKFCLNCGSMISRTEQSSIQNYSILSENRKNVAVMFADVSGFTALSEKMDPEEVREIINDCFNYITKPVYELEGSIDKYIGDCVMILFGAKHSHSDDPKRAVICGMEMQKLIKEFSEERLADKGLSLDLSIGINYGLVVTGIVGNYFDKDYTVIGDIVNTAQRLQTSADKGTLLVSESIYAETKDVIDYSEVIELSVKNKSKPVKSYSPIRLKEEANIDYMLLVERDKEINFLHSHYTNSSKTQYITVIGEAGIGKTSLIKRFTTEFSTEIKKVWITCNPMYQNRVYYLLANILLNILNINTEDTNRVKENRLKSYIDYILKDTDFTEEEIIKNYNFISLIIGLERDNEFQYILNAMDYNDLQREIVTQLVIFFHYTLIKNRYIFIVDDIQWADKTSLSLLKELIKTLTDVKTLFIFASRYNVEELNDLQNYQENIITLQGLNREGIENLTNKLLHCNKLDDIFLETIVKYTNGNPLYIKEFIATLTRKEAFSITKDIAYINEEEISNLPNSIERLILGNLAELDDNTKEFLQIASIIGKEFKLSWVTSLLNKYVDQEEILKILIKLNVITLQSVQTNFGNVDKVYTFNQDTIRETIYNSVLNKVKQDLHKRLGELIELQYNNELENYYEILCIHFEKGGSLRKAEDYYYKTALKYKNDFNFENALKYYEMLLNKVNLNEDKNKSRIVEVLVDTGYIYSTITNYDKAIDYLNRALDLATLADNKYTIEIMLANIYKEKGLYNDSLTILEQIQPKLRHTTSLYGELLQLKCSILGIMGNKEALELAKESEEILLRTKDFGNLAETMSQAGIIYFINGDIDNSIYYLNKAYQYAEKVSNLKAILRISGNLGIIYHASGMVSKALNNFSKAIEIAEKISNLPGRINGNINLGILYMEKGLFDNAEKQLNEALKFSKEMSLVLNESLSLTNLGELMYERGKYDRAMEYYDNSLMIAQKHSLHAEEGFNYISIAKVYLAKKDYDNAIHMLDKGYKNFETTNAKIYLIDFYRYKSVFALKNGDLSKALKYSEESVSIAEEVKNDMKKLKALRLLGYIYLQKNDFDKALYQFEESVNLAEQLESDYEAAKGYYRKAMLLRKMNRLTESTTNLKKAEELINKVDQCRWTEIIKEQIN